MATTVISSDSHVTEPPDTYAPRIDPAFRDDAPYLTHDEERGDLIVIPGMKVPVPMGLVAAAGKQADEITTYGAKFDELHRGGWDPTARLAEQDRDGVSAEVIYPTVGMVLCNHRDIDYKKACLDAYNLWMAEYCSHSPDRLIGVGQTAMRTPDEGIADMQKIKELGLKGVMMPGTPGQEDYDHPMYDPFWEAAVDIGLPLSFHVLTTRDAQPRGPKLNTFLSIIRSNQDIIGTLIFSGVFDRHPDLRIVCVEADAGWVPHYMYRMDHAYKRHRNHLTSAELSKMPSQFFRENIYVTFQDDWVAFQMTGLMNVDRLMWANDFPHSDSTWPWSQEMLAEHTAQLTDEETDKILHDNVAALYALA